MNCHSNFLPTASRSAWLLAFIAIGLSSLAWGAVPKVLHYQGYLTDATGEAVDCPDAASCNGMQYNMTFRLYDSAQGGSMLWEEKVNSVPIRQGVFNMLLGDENPIDAGTLDLDAVYLGLTINGTEELLPRQRFVSAAYAIRAEHAQDANTLGGKAATDFVANEAIAGLCITDDELTTILTEKNYCTECYTDTHVEVYLTDNGYMPGPGYSDGQVQTYLDTEGYVSGPHTENTDTQLTVEQVLKMVVDAGYISGPHTENTDTQLTVEQVLKMVIDAGYISGPHTENTDTQLTVEQVLKMVVDAGYISGPHTENTDTQLTVEQVLKMVGDAGYVSGPHTTDTDTHLSSAEVLSMVSTGGYVTGEHTVDTTRSDAEIQAVVGPHTTDTKLSTDEVLKIVGDAGFLMASDLPTAIPSGMIGFFPGTCPGGWTDLSASFGGRALVLAPEGGNVGENGTVGTPLTNLETPTITDVAAHTHEGPNHTHSGPSHTHSLNVTGSTTYSGDHAHATACHGKCNNCPGNGHEGGGGSQKKNTTCMTSTNGNHNHSVTLNGSLGTGGTEATGSSGTGSTGSTGSAAVDVNLPYIQLRACQAP